MKHFQDGQYSTTDSCVAFGSFDGVHIGHRAVLEKLVELSDIRGLSPVVVSFDRDSSDAEQILTTEKEKCYLLRGLPIAAVVSVSAQPEDETFFKEILKDKLGAKVVVVGKNYENSEILREFGKINGIEVIECEAAKDSGGPITSSRIKDALQTGDMETATRLMGHPFIVIGKVVPGKQLGRTVGQPTANIEYVNSKYLPLDGSYVSMTIMDEKRRVGTLNIGTRPSVDNYSYKTVENHIIDFSGDLYGKELIVEIHRFIRGVMKFNNLQEVRAQVLEDLRGMREYIDSLE